MSNIPLLNFSETQQSRQQVGSIPLLSFSETSVSRKGFGVMPKLRLGETVVSARYVDEIRLTQSVARYSDNHTPQETQFLDM